MCVWVYIVGPTVFSIYTCMRVFCLSGLTMVSPPDCCNHIRELCEGKMQAHLVQCVT